MSQTTTPSLARVQPTTRLRAPVVVVVPPVEVPESSPQAVRANAVAAATTTAANGKRRIRMLILSRCVCLSA